MKHKVVSKAIHKKLPYSGGPTIQWSNFWLKWWWDAVGPSKKVSWRPKFFIYMRMANVHSFSFGPMKIVWPARWLEGPARQSHPEVFK